MQTYPKFLNYKPRFYGMSFIELMCFCIMIYVGAYLELNPIIVLALSALTVYLSSVFRKNIDFIGYLKSVGVKTFYWMDTVGGEVK